VVQDFHQQYDYECDKFQWSFQQKNILVQLYPLTPKVNISQKWSFLKTFAFPFEFCSTQFSSCFHVNVSENSGNTPKSSIFLKGFPWNKPSILGYHYFWKHLIHEFPGFFLTNQGPKNVLPLLKEKAAAFLAYENVKISLDEDWKRQKTSAKDRWSFRSFNLDVDSMKTSVGGVFFPFLFQTFWIPSWQLGKKHAVFAEDFENKWAETTN